MPSHWLRIRFSISDKDANTFKTLLFVCLAFLYLHQLPITSQKKFRTASSIIAKQMQHVQCAMAANTLHAAGRNRIGGMGATACVDR